MKFLSIILRCLPMLVLSVATAAAQSPESVATDPDTVAVPDIVTSVEISGLAEAADDDSLGNMAADAFLLIPDADLDLLPKTTRAQMAIYMANDSIYKARNIYTGLSWIEKMTSDYLKVHLTNVSSMEIKVLPAKKLKGKLIMTVYTIDGESSTSDSSIKFYLLSNPSTDDAYLTSLPMKKFFKLPNPKDFYDTKAVKKGMSIKELLDEMPFHTIAFSIAPDEDLLTGRLTIDNYLTLEQRKKIDPYIRSILTWEWDGEKFRLQQK